MKRSQMVVVSLALLALLLAAGCAKAQPIELGEKDVGRTFDLAAGQRFTVRLPSNATTGFTWEVVYAGSAVQIGEPVYEAPREPGVVGAGGTQVFTFEAGSGGPAELRLEYRRPWEKGVPAEKEWSVTVE